MFFNSGPFNFGFGEQPPRRNHNNNQNNSGFFGGVFNGFNDFLRNDFMNPFSRPNHQQQQQQQHPQEPRPTYSRTNQKKSKTQKQKEKEQPKKSEPIYNENTGFYWKEKGNAAFKQGNYESAYLHYSKAIELNSSESVFFSNRARCLRKMGKLEEALKDAQQAVQLDADNIKGHLISGQLLAQIGKFTKNQQKVKTAINRLTKALTLCSGQKKLQYQRQLSIYIYRAKKLLWFLKFNELREARINAINQYKMYIEKDPNMTRQQLEAKMERFIDATNETVIFQIPDYLCCRITLDLMEDPVTTDCGQTYERSAIEEHIQRNGKTDPFTRKPISGNLYPSINLKKAIQDFLEKNPWAYEFSENQDFMQIPF